MIWLTLDFFRNQCQDYRRFLKKIAMEDIILMNPPLERPVVIPNKFSIGDLTANGPICNYQSISPEVKDDYFAPKNYSGTAILRIEPAREFIEKGKPIFPGLSDALATLSGLHSVVRDDPEAIYAKGFRAIIIPVASIKKLHGQSINLMISHVELFGKDLGWKMGIMFNWKDCKRIAEFHLAYLDVPF